MHDYKMVLDSAFLGAVEPQSLAWFITLTLNGHDTSFKIDTGAAVTAISEEMHETPAPTDSLRTVTAASQDPRTVLRNPITQAGDNSPNNICGQWLEK